VETSEPANTKEEEGEVVIEASSILLTSIDIAEFLSEECDSAPTFYARALAKILASACIVVDTKEKAFKFVSGRGCCLLSWSSSRKKNTRKRSCSMEPNI
jgi:hypothetical protein